MVWYGENANIIPETKDAILLPIKYFANKYIKYPESTNVDNISMLYVVIKSKKYRKIIARKEL